MKTAKDMMTKKVISVDPDASIVEAVNILFKYNFNGLPVVDKDKNLVGILTQYDLVTKSSSVYLPTFVKLFGELNLYKKDKNLIGKDLKRILTTKVSSIMNPEPLTLNENAPLEDVVKAFTEHHRVNPILVVNESGGLVGVISRYDMLKFLNLPGIKNTDLENGNQRNIDKDVDHFLKHLEKQFILVSKFRTRFWFIASVLFALIGYIIAWALILRFR